MGKWKALVCQRTSKRKKKYELNGNSLSDSAFHTLNLNESVGDFDVDRRRLEVWGEWNDFKDCGGFVDIEKWFLWVFNCFKHVRIIKKP